MTRIRIDYGTLPSRSYLFIACADVTPRAYPDELLALMRQSLRQYGPNEHVHAVLRQLGFVWDSPRGCTCGAVPCLCIEVQAVREALER